MQRHNLGKGVLVVAGLSFVFFTSRAQAAAPPVSSPEGTLTTFVAGKNSLIYPPRSARAQKVDFDTAEKQMIYEADTPFRAFFNARSADFQPNKVDYAKTTILGDIIAMLRNRVYIERMVAGVIGEHLDALNPPVPPKPALNAEGQPDPARMKQWIEDKAVQAALRARNAKMLAAALALILERENYPEMREEGVERILADIAGHTPAPEVRLPPQSTQIWYSVVAELQETNLLWELRQVLCERRYFRTIIDEASARRPELFRNASSPVPAMKDAQETLGQILKDHLVLFVNELGGQRSLWEAFLRSLNGSDNRAWKQRADTNALPEAELEEFGKALRTELLVLMDEGATLDAAMKVALQSRRQYLVPTEGSLRTEWKNRLKVREALLVAHAKLNESAAALRNRTTELNTARGTMGTAEVAVATAKTSAQDAVGKINAILDRFERPRADLDRAFNTLNDGAPNLVALANQAAGVPGGNAAMTNIATEIRKLVGELDELRGRYRAEDSAAIDQMRSDAASFPNRPDAASAALRQPGNKFVPFATTNAGEGLVTNILALAAEVQKVAQPTESTNKPAWTNGQLASIELKNVWAPKAQAALAVHRNAGTGGREQAITALKSAEIDKALGDYEAAVVARRNAGNAEGTATTLRDAAKAAYDTAESAFSETLSTEMTNVGASFPAPQNLAALRPAVTARLKTLLTEARLGLTNNVPALESLLEEAFKVELLVDTTESERRVVSRFVQAFGIFPGLMKSDEPILKAVIKSGKISFPSPEFAKLAAERIAAETARRLAEGGAARGTNLVSVTESLKTALEQPDIVYLFGNGAANTRVTEAFKAEFYNAFKHRLAEALKAEREADYDYWWFSFYPKAVGVGANQFRGQSILEVGFNDSIVPVQQYHRWLQDQQLVTDRSGKGDEHRVRLAAAVLNDFLAALNSSLISDRFPQVRETIQETLARLSAPKKQNGDSGFSNYRDAMRYLITAATNVISGETNAILQFTNSLTLEMNSLTPEAIEVFLAATNRASDPVNQYFLKAANTFFNPTSATVAKMIETNALAQYELEARSGLAWLDMDIRHVAFAALTASLRNALLPQKVELYCSAFWGGSRRFNPNYTPADLSVLYRTIPRKEVQYRIMADKYVVPFERIVDQLELSRHLLVSGVSDYSVGLLLDRFKHISGIESSTLERLVALLQDAKFTTNRSDVRTNSASALTEYRNGFRTFLSTNNASTQCGSVELFMRYAANLSNDTQCRISEQLFKNVKYRPNQKPSLYLTYPILWPLEIDLGKNRDRLRSIIVHLYHSEYPSIPDPFRIKSDFLNEHSVLRSLAYDWLRDFYIHLFESGLLAPVNGNLDPDERESLRRRRVMVAGNLLLDRHSYLTSDSRRHLLSIFTDKRSIYDWLDAIGAEQQIMDQLNRNLLETLHQSVFAALEQLNEIERQSVPFKDIKDHDFERFRLHSKPRLQKGIQIVDLLPSSRDDLVSMSINEGGVVAKIAGQVEGAAAYDMNQLQTVLRNAQLLDERLRDKTAGAETAPDLTEAGVEELSSGRSVSKSRAFSELSRVGQGANLSGYSLGATAQGSVYGRAKSALAYSRRREYLDAVITSAGRGDNFAKWVIRPSDLRSELAARGGRKLVAAAHNGYPNGDQPFHMLVKVPRSAVHTDWSGRRYVYFNSAYSATGKQSFWRDFGLFGALVKVPFTVINHNAWHKLEEHMVTAVFPFMWNVPTSKSASPAALSPRAMQSRPDSTALDAESALQKMGRTANILGGEILLDDTDRIRYSEIRTMLDAEADFVQLTRQAQLADLNNVMNEVQKEAGTFRTNVVNSLRDRLNSARSLQESQSEAAKFREKQEKLEAELQRLNEEVKALQEKGATGRDQIQRPSGRGGQGTPATAPSTTPPSTQ